MVGVRLDQDLFVLILDSDLPPPRLHFKQRTYYFVLSTYCVRPLYYIHHFVSKPSHRPESPLFAQETGLVSVQPRAAGLVAFPCRGAILEAATAGRARSVAVPAAPARGAGSLGEPGPEARGERQLSMSRPGTAPPRGRPGAGAERRGGEGRGARGGTEEGRRHRRLGLGAPRKSRSESCERLEKARSAQSGSEVRSEGPPYRRRPLLPPVQPGSPRRRRRPPMEFT